MDGIAMLLALLFLAVFLFGMVGALFIVGLCMAASKEPKHDKDTRAHP
jgi:hypothetical protein